MGMEDDLETMIEEAYDLIAEIASDWQGDTATDEVARSIIGSSNPIFLIMEKMVKNKDFTPNMHVMMLMVKLSYAQILAIKELEQLGKLKKEAGE